VGKIIQMKLLVILILNIAWLVACQGNQQHEHSHKTDDSKKILGKDYVCDMNVTDSTYKAEYEGKTYYFCAEVCKEEFMKEPQKYLSKN